MVKDKILIVYDFFFPGYKAGGPVQSLVNLISELGEDYAFYILTSAYDLHETVRYKDIKCDEWNLVDLVGTNKTVNIWYSGTGRPSRSDFKKVVSIKPSICYFNNIFSYRFFLLPLVYLRHRESEIRVVVCPRGMLHKGALKLKRFKKKIYLGLIRKCGLLKNVVWHVTNEIERKDVRDFLPNANAVVASNVPKLPISKPLFAQKPTGKLRLVYLSLISEKKNLDLLLSVLEQCRQEVTLDVYGPVKDIRYWEACREKIQRLCKVVQYKGSVSPWQSQEIIADYDALILLSEGENFGHAMFESLSVARPIIVSQYTPWNELETLRAGWNLDINNKKALPSLIDNIALLHPDQYVEFCQGAYKLATAYVAENNYKAQYRELFADSLNPTEPSDVINQEILR